GPRPGRADADPRPDGSRAGDGGGGLESVPEGAEVDVVGWVKPTDPHACQVASVGCTHPTTVRPCFGNRLQGVGRLHQEPETLRVSPRQKILVATDRVQGALLVVLVLGSAVCFGGAVWWFPPAVAGLASLLVATKLVQLLLMGRMPLLKSPLTLL